MKLYELTEMYSDLFNQFDAINEWEPDTNADGMPIDDDGNIIANVDAYRNKMLTAWFDTLTGIEGEFDEKAESIAIYYKQLLAEAKMLKAEKAAIAKRQSQKENKRRALKPICLSQCRHSADRRLICRERLCRLKRTLRALLLMMKFHLLSGQRNTTLTTS